MSEMNTERPPADPTLPPPPALPNPETERILQAIRELGAKVELAGNIANDAQSRADEVMLRLERATDVIERVGAKLALVAEQAESAIAIGMNAHQKINRTYDQVHRLSEHVGCTIIGEETEESALGSTSR